MKKTYDISPLARKSGGTAYEIKGLYYRPKAMASLYRSVNGQDRTDVIVQVSLVPEPDNPYDKNAISVRYKGKSIGYLPAENAAKFAQIRRVAASGLEATTTARFWSYKDYENKRRYTGWIELPAPHNIVPLNDPPTDGFTVLPIGNAIQVTKEADHLDVLLDYVPPAGEGHILVSMHRMPPVGRRTWEGVEIRLDGERVGELTKGSAEKYINAVRHFEDKGVELFCHAIIKGSSVAAEVTIFGAKAHELTEDDLEPKDYKPIPKLVPYQEAASHYDVPHAWATSIDESQQAGNINARSPQFGHVKPVDFTEAEKRKEAQRREANHNSAEFKNFSEIMAEKKAANNNASSTHDSPGSSSGAGVGCLLVIIVVVTLIVLL